MVPPSPVHSHGPVTIEGMQIQQEPRYTALTAPHLVLLTCACRGSLKDPYTELPQVSLKLPGLPIMSQAISTSSSPDGWLCTWQVTVSSTLTILKTALN